MWIFLCYMLIEMTEELQIWFFFIRSSTCISQVRSTCSLSCINLGVCCNFQQNRLRCYSLILKPVLTGNTGFWHTEMLNVYLENYNGSAQEYVSKIFKPYKEISKIYLTQNHYHSIKSATFSRNIWILKSLFLSPSRFNLTSVLHQCYVEQSTQQ